MYGTLRISGVAAELAREHGVNQDEMIKKRFFETLDALMDKTGPDQKVVELLRRCFKQRFQMGIVTFVRKARISRRLDVWKLQKIFQSVITPDDLKEVKPSPKPFLKAMDELQVQPAECFVIGDEPVDMIGGKQAGATTIGLPQGFFTREELESAGADHILSSLDKLPEIVPLS